MNVKQTLLCNNELYLYVYLHEHVICSKIRITIESQACSEVVMDNGEAERVFYICEGRKAY